MRRLYVQIWLSFLAIGLGSLFVSALVALLLFGHPDPPADAAVIGAYRIARLPPPDDPAFAQALEETARAVEHELTLWDADGRLLASTVDPPLALGEPGFFHGRDAVGVRFALPDGRMVVAGRAPEGGRRLRFLLWVATFAAVVAAGCYPLARRITRRLEGVQQGLARWGAGDLAARVPVSGRDEVAAVARAFNDAADRVEALFEAQRRVLASASHELRSPLARLRMALELLDDGDPDRRALVGEAVRDVEDLDALVGDLLQVGRMQVLGGPEDPRPVALLPLLAEEAARTGAAVEGPAVEVLGDARLLRHLARNLLENAVRHGRPPIEVRTTLDGFEVLDRGPGVPEALRERIFEPFFRPEGHAEGRDGGVGLGLHLAREIARHHGGTVTVAPREGGGSRFVVRLGRAG